MRFKKKFFRLSIILVAFFISIAFFDIFQGNLDAFAENVYTNCYMKDCTNDSNLNNKVKTIECDYQNVDYVSLRDMAVFYKNSDKQYNITISDDTIIINNGTYVSVGTENKSYEDLSIAPKEPWEEQKIKSNKIYYNGKEVKYETLIKKIDSNNYDCWMNINNVILLFNRSIDSDETSYHVHENQQINYDLDTLKSLDLESACGSCLCGELNSESIYYSINDDKPLAIASTTKLMTLFIVMDEISAGNISLDEKCNVSKYAEKSSLSDDGTVKMQQGQTVTVEELIYLLMLPSANEAAICLAEHICQTEDNFVDKMNKKAQDLSLKNTKFWNCSGLPHALSKTPNSKIQNYSTAKDMFYLSCSLVKNYPEIQQYTSTKEYESKTFNKTVKNTNSLLFNIDNCVGLKTGSTNRADSCLITLSDKVNDNQIITVSYGFDTSELRNIATTYLFNYAYNVASNNIQQDFTSIFNSTCNRIRRFVSGT